MVGVIFWPQLKDMTTERAISWPQLLEMVMDEAISWPQLYG